jgi:hypothetical protein
MMTGTQSSAEDTDFRDSEQFRAECEARFWLSQYHKREALEGRAAARAWWNETIQRIARIRGQKGADYLRDMMNRKEWTGAASGKKRPESP